MLTRPSYRSKALQSEHTQINTVHSMRSDTPLGFEGQQKHGKQDTGSESIC